MDEKSIEIMRRLLLPITLDQANEIARQRVGADSGGEQLTLGDAGLEDEVRALRAERGAELGRTR